MHKVISSHMMNGNKIVILHETRVPIGIPFTI